MSYEKNTFVAFTKFVRMFCSIYLSFVIVFIYFPTEFYVFIFSVLPFSVSVFNFRM